MVPYGYCEQMFLLRIHHYNQHLYKSSVPHTQLCLWPLQILITLPTDVLVEFFAIWGWEMAGGAKAYEPASLELSSQSVVHDLSPMANPI